MVKGFRRWFLITISLFGVMFLLLLVQEPGTYSYASYMTSLNEEGGNSITEISNTAIYEQGKWRNLSLKQRSKLSTLGRILYLDEEVPASATLKTYKILIWKHGPSLERRHIKHYTNQLLDPFENCTVRNCQLTYKDADVSTADLIIFHLHRTKGVEELPKGPRDPKQIWAFLTDESPFHTFMFSKNNTMNRYDGLFNWSMTYRMDSDIPVPYGRTVALKRGLETMEVEDFEEWNTTKKQDVLIAIMGSNCGSRNNRWQYVKELKKHIEIDVYGGCGTLKCPGHFTKDCDEISKYKFYLSFENSNCDEYVTEKLWWNGYAKNAIPIVMGASRFSYKQLLPPNSYINVDDFAAPRDLANFIHYLNKTPLEMAQYFAWKKHFKVVNEHGYFRTPSYHYCRACQALNYNDRKISKVYNDLLRFWSRNDCHESWDAQVK